MWCRILYSQSGFGMARLRATSHNLVILLLCARHGSAWMTGTVLSGVRALSSSSTHSAKELDPSSLYGANTPDGPDITTPLSFRREAYNPFASESSTLKLNDEGNAWLPQRQRPRRNRKSPAMRDAVRENIVTPSDFVYPLFIHEEDYVVEIPSMPGCMQYSLRSMLEEVAEAWQFGVRSFVCFPKISGHLKSNNADEAYNPDGIVPRAISMIKSRFPGSVVSADVALDCYSDHGHDGVVKDGKILNDETVVQLTKQAICQARAGADVVAPSDMMDGRVGAIRDALESCGFTDVAILSYTAKYASALYGTFRDAVDSQLSSGDNKKTYHMDPANAREALVEASLDAAEGADILMVKPGLPYLDVVHRLRTHTNLPIAAYHVSGEYSMLKAAAEKGWLDERKTVLENMLCFKRAGVDIIYTYYAKQAAQWLCEEGPKTTLE